MNKKLLTVLVAVLLIVTMSVCLFACSDADTTEAKKSSSFSTKEGTSSKSVTKSIQINEKTSFDIISSAVMSEADIQSKISVKDQDGNAVVMKATMTGDKQFRVAPFGNSKFVAGKWYEFELLDSKLSFANYEDATKLSMYVLAGNSTATFNDNVIYLTAGSSYIDNFSSNGALKTFEFDALSAGQTLKMGQIVLVEDTDSGEYTAYQILGVEATERTGIYTVAYAAPSYEEVYEKLEAQETSVLGKDGEVEINDAEIQDAISEALSMAGFNVGAARFDINASLNKEDKIVTIDVTVKIPDMIGDKDGVNSLDLVLNFKIETKITVDTDISIGKLLEAKDNGIELVAKFDNTLTFTAKVVDGADVANVSELDAVISKIANMLKGADENDITIDVFNWIIPIGNGIADINFDVNVAMNFRFSGELGVSSTSNATIDTRIFFNPSTEEKDFGIVGKPTFNFQTVDVFLDGEAAAYIGIEAAIKFELLGGVISVGVGAEVGNFNKIYGKIGARVYDANREANDTTAILDSTTYGAYLEGGIYYDAKFLYNVAKITSGSISFFGGRQEKVLYNAGSKYIVTALQDTTMKVSTVATDIAINCTYEDIVAKTVVGSWTNIIEAKKIVEVSESNANANYVEIVNGQIYLTEAGVAANLKGQGYFVTVEADGKQATITIDPIETKQTTANVAADIYVGEGVTVVAAYLDGTAANVVYDSTKTNAKVSGATAGVIVVYVNGEVYCLVNVA